MPWGLIIPDYPNIPVTTRHLSTHTASIDDDSEVTDNYYGYPDPTMSLAECMAAYFSTGGDDYNDYWNFYSNAPGTLYEYSNMGSALNGYMVEVSTGQLFDDYCDENLFVPLGMDNTAWHYADFDPNQIATPYQYTGGDFVAYDQYGFADYPNGQLRSNVLDLSKFMMAYLNGGTFGSTSILSPTSIDEMWTPQITSLDANQGISWYTEEFTYSGGTKNLWGHNGGEQGVSTEMYLDPDTNIGVCVLTNGEGSAFGIAEKLYDYGLSIVTTSQSDVSVQVDNIELFPNPVEGIFSISGQVGGYSVEIVDGIGQVYQTIEATDNVSIDISDFPSGLILRLYNKEW